MNGILAIVSIGCILVFACCKAISRTMDNLSAATLFEEATNAGVSIAKHLSVMMSSLTAKVAKRTSGGGFCEFGNLVDVITRIAGRRLKS